MSGVQRRLQPLGVPPAFLRKPTNERQTLTAGALSDIIQDSTLGVASRESQPKQGVRTRAIPAGEGPDPVTGASAPNLVMSTTFVVEEAGGSFSALNLPEDAPFVYTRWNNPTVAQLETKLADLEGGDSAVAFSTGMAAAVALFLHLLRAGDHLVISDVAYAGVAEVVRDTLVKMGVQITAADLSDPDDLRRALRPKTRLVWAETRPTPSCASPTSASRRHRPPGGAELAVTPPSPRHRHPPHRTRGRLRRPLAHQVHRRPRRTPSAGRSWAKRTPGQAAPGHRHSPGRLAEPLQRLAHHARPGHAASADGGPRRGGDEGRPLP